MITSITYSIAFIFSLAMISKLMGKSKPTFQKAGYSMGFMYVVAVLQATLTAGLFTPYALWSAIGLLLIMAGVFYTLIKIKESWQSYILAVLATVLLLALAGLSVIKQINKI
ncbi:DoxX family protein [Chryseobacterium arthrosphaerae]|uniref:DoxX family protein n=1 Tax=Chryseobacterium arthrosphaerae TaxID=651561 RepID=UPI001F4B1839|nr:DoxX family protein [Chryseobacterium arthrosphaerae]